MWMIIGAILAVLLFALVIWLRRGGYTLKWFDWILGIIGVALLLFTLENFLGSFDEEVPQAAWMFLVVTGIPTLVIFGIVGIQLWRRARTSA
jgi:uncharacterized membrane protein